MTRIYQNTPETNQKAEEIARACGVGGDLMTLYSEGFLDDAVEMHLDLFNQFKEIELQITAENWNKTTRALNNAYALVRSAQNNRDKPAPGMEYWTDGAGRAWKRCECWRHLIDPVAGVADNNGWHFFSQPYPHGATCKNRDS